jgi:hypothetical protein
MDIYIGRAAYAPEEYGNSWVMVPEVTLTKLKVSKNERSYRAVCRLTGIVVYVLRNSGAGAEIAKRLEAGEISELSDYITRLVLGHCTVPELHTAIGNRLQKEYERGREEMQEEIKELLGL